ncbi:hypothetical protein [Bacillus infantis]|uniref:hypothetical protein n=1 Tax=Bacillus infantis TaxID=324767 RepID=UPI003CF9DED0
MKMRMCGKFGDFQGNSGRYCRQLKQCRNFIEFTAGNAGCLVWLAVRSSGLFCFFIKVLVTSIICGIILINPPDNLLKLPIILPFQQNQASFDGSDGYPAPLSFQEQRPISVFLSKCWLFQSFAGLF